MVQAVAWNDRIDEIRELGYEVATVTYDDVGKLRRLERRQKIDYPMLSDVNSDIIRAFGLLAENYPQGSFYYGVPHPAIVVLDAAGNVSHRFSERHYTTRPDIEDVLAVLREDATS
ncbi:MAG: redoxin domain-containing protein [Rhodospirillaceae bacterium]|nr:redoxin domain-containing protein [Rhodospirillaceae bacterium]MBT3808364.1 redoxin domain-containing protein [Rhodospirillaceae bacterium]MBT4772997.1 redoxin domain-containing protein [Rhodospirillaceae bacterium]MBT5359027.1 redoxin domain-containing protein [Rhodospirillaceae bacterium]MBT5767831.1 redoxin domain-containing protein [Rhodospirillaceae bacterium]